MFDCILKIKIRSFEIEELTHQTKKIKIKI
jgi:hypothetical protein